MHEDYLNNRNMEIMKCKSDLDASGALHQTLVAQHKRGEADLNNVRETIARDAGAIAETHRTNDLKTGELNALQADVSSSEHHANCQKSRIDDLN